MSVSHGKFRFHAGLTTVFLLGIVVLANRLSRDHLSLRVDLTEEGLHTLSPATERLLGGLDDVLQVDAFLTGEPEHAAVQIARGRMLDLLRELQGASGGRMELRLRDPNSSSEDRLEAQKLGIPPVPHAAFQGTSTVQQDLYFGLVLRYHGGERVLPFCLPQNLEHELAFAVHGLSRERQPVVGTITGVDMFRSVRDVLSLSYRVKELAGLDSGDPIPDDVDLLLVLAPVALRVRAAFAIDQFAQSGKPVVMLLDEQFASQAGLERIGETGVDPLLRAWGTPLSNGIVWDDRCNIWRVERRVQVGGGSGVTTEPVTYYYWPRVEPEAMATDHPVTAAQPGVNLYWAHGVGDRNRPEGVRRTELLATSERAWIVPPPQSGFGTDPADLKAKALELAARGDAARHALCVLLEGPLPSAFAEGAPAPFDPFVPAGAPAVTDEPVVSAERDARVVVMGDSDWVRDGSTFQEENRMFLSNLVDWMVLEHDLVALRSRRPLERRIVDFEEEARAAIPPPDPNGGWSEAEELSRLHAEASQVAQRRRWTAVLTAAAGSLALFLVAVVALRLPRLFGGGS